MAQGGESDVVAVSRDGAIVAHARRGLTSPDVHHQVRRPEFLDARWEIDLPEGVTRDDVSIYQLLDGTVAMELPH